MRKLYFLGDTHGVFSYLTLMILSYDMKECDFVLCGDAGIGFNPSAESTLFDSLNTSLKKHNCTLSIIRGNHDNPAYFTKDSSLNRSNILIVEDYTVLDLCNHKILCIGGSISVDRKQRDSNTYWIDEPTKFIKSKCENLEGIDIVASHDFFNPDLSLCNEDFIHHYEKDDDDLEEDMTIQKVTLRSIYREIKEKNKIKEWFHGHYHKSCNYMHNEIKVTALGINELKQLK